MPESTPTWQSKLILLAVFPFIGAHVVLEAHWWINQAPAIAIWTLGLSALFGLVTWRVRAATPWAAAGGAALVASLMFSTTTFPYSPWRTAFVPVLALVVLTFITTRLGRMEKERLGIAEGRRGRLPSQVAANLGMAAIVSSEFMQSWFVDAGLARQTLSPLLMFSLSLAALAEAAADTASSEVGQAFGGRPRLITTLRPVDPGTDGAISFAGSLAGILAAAFVTAVGTLAFSGDRVTFAVSAAGGIFGLFFDSLLGATFQKHGWINNDLVNFLSTAGAAAFTMLLLALVPSANIG